MVQNRPGKISRESEKFWISQRDPFNRKFRKFQEENRKSNETEIPDNKYPKSLVYMYREVVLFYQKFWNILFHSPE